MNIRARLYRWWKKPVEVRTPTVMVAIAGLVAIAVLVVNVWMVLLIVAVSASALQKQEPSVTRVASCKVVGPPSDAKPNTTTLDCGKDLALEIPEWFAAFKGETFRLEILENGSHRLAKEQPEGSEIRYAPPCPIGYQRRALQAPPCNPELKPQ